MVKPILITSTGLVEIDPPNIYRHFSLNLQASYTLYDGQKGLSKLEQAA